MKARNLMLKTVGSKGESYGGFVWPLEVGTVVTAPDWDPSKECGGGLHGLLWGSGDARLLDWSFDSNWLVIEALEALVNLDDKAKCKSAIIRYVGDRHGATQYLYSYTHGPNIAGITLTGGHGAMLTGGYGAILTGGDGARLTGGDGAMLTGGYGAILTGGHGAILTGGDGATLTGGDGAILTGGHGATLTGGDVAILTGGDRARLTGGWRAILAGGNAAMLIGGENASYQGGLYTAFVNTCDMSTAKIDGVEMRPDTRYLSRHGRWVEIK